MEIPQLLNKLIEKKDMTTIESRDFLTAVMKGEVLPTQIAAMLTALRSKGETVDEITGLIQAMREQMVVVSVDDAIDVCGTGGDGSKSFNISTCVAFVVAAAGVKVAKHGNRAASSTCGSADVLESLGVHITLTAEQAKDVCEKTGMVFLFAPLFHPATKQVAMVRKELKIRTVFNFLGPFLSPANVTHQLIGVPNRQVAEKLILVGEKLGYKHLLIVAAEDGMDEVSLFAKTHVLELKNNRIKRFVIDPQEFSFKKSQKKDIEEGTLTENAQFIRDILQGQKGAKRDIVILNSAVVFYTKGTVKNIKEGIALAEKVIDNGSAQKVLQNVIKETQRYA